MSVKLPKEQHEKPLQNDDAENQKSLPLQNDTVAEGQEDKDVAIMVQSRVHHCISLLGMVLPKFLQMRRCAWGQRSHKGRKP